MAQNFLPCHTYPLLSKNLINKIHARLPAEREVEVRPISTPATPLHPRLVTMAISFPQNQHAMFSVPRKAPTASAPSSVYQFEGSVPSGPLSVVHFARHLPSGKSVVLKTYLKRDLLRHGAIEHALAERETLAAVHDVAGAAQLLHATHDARSLTLILLRAPGVPADKLGEISVERASRIMRSIVCAVRGIHSRNVVHRDLALRNILVADDGSVTIVDFGAAVSRGRVGRLADPGVTPPEALVASAQAPPTDIWGLGVSAYGLLTGNRTPFCTIEEVELFAKDPWPVLKDVKIGGSPTPAMKKAAADFVQSCLHPVAQLRLGGRKSESETEIRDCAPADVEAALWDIDYDAILAHPFLNVGGPATPSADP